jgi:hypothetical protein
MLCPFCLSENGIRVQSSAYRCSNQPCQETLPALYAQQYRGYPPVVASAIGFRGHGKTAYFSALFYSFKRLPVGKYWERFYTQALNEESLDTVKENVRILETGKCPPASPKNFPRPTMVRMAGIPAQPDATMLFYDTAGECFERPKELVKYAGFVSRARTAMLLLSIPDMKNPADEMHELLEVYVMGMAQLGAPTRGQHLIVLFSKADQMLDRLAKRKHLVDYLRRGSIEGLEQPKAYLPQLHKVSRQLLGMTRDDLGGYAFVNLARANFRSVEFCMVSALGARPQGDTLTSQVCPRRIMDPLVWILEKSRPRRLRRLVRWLGIPC